MVIELFHSVRWLDLMIYRKIGVAYNAVLGIGLIIEIVRRLHEAHELHRASTVQTALHQLAELSRHVDRRFRNARQAR
jgi:predicted phosphoribosyltransferase